MDAVHTITIRLNPDDYERLEQEAARQQVPVADLVSEYLHAALASEASAGSAAARERGLAALDKLAALRERLPDLGPIDVVELIHEGREELDKRTPI